MANERYFMNVRAPAITLVEKQSLGNDSSKRFDILLFGKFYSEVTFSIAGYLSRIPTSRFGSVCPGEVSIERIKREIELQNQHWADLSMRLIEVATSSTKNDVAITLIPNEVNQTVMLFGMVFGETWRILNKGDVLPLPKPNGDIEFLPCEVTPAQKEFRISQINALWAAA